MGKTRELGYLKNVLAYDASGLTGYVPNARTLTINGTTLDLSTNRTFNIATSATLGGLTDATISSLVDNQILKYNAATSKWVNWTPNYLTGITSSQVTTALGFTPYNSTNPSGYITGINSSMVTTALGYTPVTTARTITINGTAYDLSADRSWTITASTPTQLVSPNGGSVIAGDSALPSTANSFIHTLGLGPGGNDGHIMAMTWTNTGTYGAQIWMDTDPTNRMAIRSRNSAGTWNGWSEVISENNRSSYIDTIYYGGSARLWSGSDGTRNSGWAYHQDNNTGVHWPNNGWHLYPKNSSDFYVRSGASDASIQFMRSGTTANYIHNASDNAIGFLSTSRSWILRVDNGGNTTSYGTFTANGLIRVNGNTNLYLDYNYGCSIVGVYSASRYQGVFSMGDAYKLAIDGTSAGNLYGLAWSHQNAGGQAGYLTTHGLLVMENGVTNTALSNSIWCRGDITAYSDARVKENVEVIDNAMEKINAIRGVTFTRTDMADKDKRYAGVIAQEVLEVLPEVVTTNEANGHHSVSYGNLNALTIEGLKEHDKIIKKQAEEIKQLKEIINGLTK